MGDHQDTEQLIEKLAELIKVLVRNKSYLILITQGSNEILEVSAEELEKLRPSKRSGKTTVLGSLANLAQIEKDISNQVYSASEYSRSNWILDSGASAHVTGRWSEFASYDPYPITRKETIQTADGTYQPVKGVGTVKCTPSITLSSVLYAPSFPVNLVSLSSLVDHMDCRVTLDRVNCIIAERETGKRLGIGVRQKGLWYLDRRETDNVLCTALTVVASEDEAMVILQHCRLGHMSIGTMSKIFPDEMKKVKKEKLVCDACEYGKHTRTSYVSRGLRSTSPFVLIHSDV